jgi:ribonuclease HII
MEQIGIDEAGVGPLAGPLVAAIVALPDGALLRGVKDSKKMSDYSREEAIDSIYSTATLHMAVYAGVEDIDSEGVWVMWDSMCRTLISEARSSVGDSFRRIMIDGNKRPKDVPNIVTVVGGDNLYLSISAASVIAKYAQCLHMDALHSRYPEYDFNKSRGYASPKHIAALKKYGAIRGVHRAKYVTTLSGNQGFDLKWRKQ